MTKQEFEKLEPQITEAIRKAVLETLIQMGDRAFQIEWFNPRTK